MADWCGVSTEEKVMCAKDIELFFKSRETRAVLRDDHKKLESYSLKISVNVF